MKLEDLQKLTVTKLREEALNYPEIAGVHAMKKAELIQTLAEAKGISPEKKKDEKIVDDKGVVKKEIRRLKAQKEQAIAKKDRMETKKLRKEIKKLKRRVRRLVAEAALEGSKK
ncbi:transcription termination factor Rho [candidate division KSB1 bacterium]|nr:transcription termination factor Rho [candidate division KSB1 bacterium]